MEPEIKHLDPFHAFLAPLNLKGPIINIIFKLALLHYELFLFGNQKVKGVQGQPLKGSGLVLYIKNWYESSNVIGEHLCYPKG